MELFEKLGIDWRLIAIQIINFGIVLFILKKFLYKPVIAMLEKRRNAVRESLEATERMKKEFEDFEKQKEETLSNARAQARAVLAEASEHAATMEHKAQEAAKAKTEETMVRARKVIAEEKTKIVEEAKKEIAGLIIEATGRLLSEKAQGEEGERVIKRSLAPGHKTS